MKAWHRIVLWTLAVLMFQAMLFFWMGDFEFPGEMPVGIAALAIIVLIIKDMCIVWLAYRVQDALRSRS